MDIHDDVGPASILSSHLLPRHPNFFILYFSVSHFLEKSEALMK